MSSRAISNRSTLLPRVLLSLLFLVAGVRKVMAYGGTLGYFKALGLPFPEIVLPLVIAIEIGGSVALLAGWKLRWSAALLALFTLGSALVAHQFWKAAPAEFSGQLNNFLKNVAITGGFLLLILRGR